MQCDTATPPNFACIKSLQALLLHFLPAAKRMTLITKSAKWLHTSWMLRRRNHSRIYRVLESTYSFVGQFNTLHEWFTVVWNFLVKHLARRVPTKMHDRAISFVNPLILRTLLRTCTVRALLWAFRKQRAGSLSLEGERANYQMRIHDRCIFVSLSWPSTLHQ